MTKRIALTFFLTSLVLVVLDTVAAQGPQETLTNEKIIGLVKLGLGEAVIAEKIRRSICKCDTSTEALGKLKAARVSDSIIMAILNATTQNGEPSPSFSDTVIKVPSSNTAKVASQNARLERDLSDNLKEPGIYLYDEGKLQIIEASVFSGSKANILGTVLTYGIKKTKVKAKVRGSSANLKTTNAKPIFYFVFNPDYSNSGATMAGLFWGMPATSPNEFLMVEMQRQQASREAVLGEYGYWTGLKTGARDQDIREFAFEKVRPGVYEVRPKSDLTSGEYCFYFAGNVSGLGFAGGKIFDFSISQPQSTTASNESAVRENSDSVQISESSTSSARITPVVSATNLPVYGSVAEIKGLRQIYVFADSALSRERILKAINKDGRLQVVADPNEAELFLEFRELTRTEAIDKSDRERRIRAQMEVSYSKGGKRIIAWSGTAERATLFTSGIGIGNEYNETKLTKKFLGALGKY